jgi:hypothetical protein
MFKAESTLWAWAVAWCTIKISSTYAEEKKGKPFWGIFATLHILSNRYDFALNSDDTKFGGNPTKKKFRR